jgi:hypothetical protein
MVVLDLLSDPCEWLKRSYRLYPSFAHFTSAFI